MTQPENQPAQVGEVSDEELVKLSLADQGQFLHIVDRYKKKLLNYIRRLSGLSEEDAEDILQDVFLKVYLNLNDFDGDLKFSSWIYAITRHQVISNHRRLKARVDSSAVHLENEAVQALAFELSIDESLDRALLRERLEKIINQLDPKCREVIILRYWEEKDYREIADIMKRPAGTIASLLHKAKKDLAALWLKEKKYV